MQQETSQAQRDPLGGKDPCGLIERATLARLADTEIRSVEPLVPELSFPGAVGCSINDNEEGVTMDLIFAKAGQRRPDDSMAGASGRSQDTATIAGPKQAWVTRAAHGQPEVEVCAVTGSDVLVCAYSTAQFANPAQLEKTSTELVELLVTKV